MPKIPDVAHLLSGPLDGRTLAALGNRLWAQDGYYIKTDRRDAQGNFFWQWHPYVNKTNPPNPSLNPS